jgi:hypothetical protein
MSMDPKRATVSATAHSMELESVTSQVSAIASPPAARTWAAWFLAGVPIPGHERDAPAFGGETPADRFADSTRRRR